MVWLIVVLACVVLGLAAWAGTGRLGEMPPVVNDRPKGHIPPGPITAELLAELRLPKASSGYNSEQVDDFLARIADGEPLRAADATFDVVTRGYDMQCVDALLERLPPLAEADELAAFQPPTVTADEPEIAEYSPPRRSVTTRFDEPETGESIPTGEGISAPKRQDTE